MTNANTPQSVVPSGTRLLSMATATRTPENSMHPTWRAFIRFCGSVKHGEIERLRIQDGLPVLAEVVKKKVKFTE